MGSNIMRLGNTLNQKMQRTAKGAVPISVELGTIMDDLSLVTDTLVGNIDKADYLVDLRLTHENYYSYDEMNSSAKAPHHHEGGEHPCVAGGGGSSSETEGEEKEPETEGEEKEPETEGEEKEPETEGEEIQPDTEGDETSPDTEVDGAETGKHTHDDGLHDHRVPSVFRRLQPGDRVLVVWVGHDPVITAIVVSGDTITKN